MHPPRLELVPWLLVAACCLQPATAGTPIEDRLHRALVDARHARSAAPPARLSALDRVARERAEAIAALEHRGRLSYARPVEPAIREAGLHWFDASRVRLDLARGYTDPAGHFLRSWKRSKQGWRDAMDPRFDAVGLGVARAEDGWVIFVTILVETREPPEEPEQLALEVAEAINRVRREHGVPPLLRQVRLAEVARAHSEDMLRRGFFDHRTPEGLRAADRVRAAGMVFAAVAENIHRSRGHRDPVANAVDAWMHSRGHREAILDDGYTQTGVGVAVDRQDGTIVVTQMFFTPPARP